MSKESLIILRRVEAKIDEVQRGWSLRGRGLDMIFGDASYMRARVAPLAARLGVEPGLLLISPALARWS